MPSTPRVAVVHNTIPVVVAWWWLGGVARGGWGGGGGWFPSFPPGPPPPLSPVRLSLVRLILSRIEARVSAAS